MTPHSGVVGVVPLFVVFLARHDTLQHCYAMQIASDFKGSCPTMADLYDARFKHAKRLLDTGYSISWVLNSCCFKSNQHFSHFFKNRTGISPSEYLKLKKK